MVKLKKLEKGKSVILESYKNHSYVKRSGTITRLDHAMKWLMLGNEKIWYDDIADNVGLYKGKIRNPVDYHIPEAAYIIISILF